MKYFAPPFEDDQDLNSVLGAFNFDTFICGFDKLKLSKDKDPIVLDAVCFHEREHFNQIISTMPGLWLSHLSQAEELMELKILISSIKEQKLSDRIKYPLLSWVRIEDNIDLKNLLETHCIGFYIRNSLKNIFWGLFNLESDAHLFSAMPDYPKPKRLACPVNGNGDIIGFRTISEGMAQIKTILYLFCHREISSQSMVERIDKVIKSQFETLTTDRLYFPLLLFASEISNINFFDINNLLSYYPLIVTAGDFAINGPIYDDIDNWDDMHPGFRFKNCLTIANKVGFKKRMWSDPDKYYEYYKSIVDQVESEFGHSKAHVLTKNWLKRELSDEERVNESYILSSFRDAFVTRLSQPHFFAWSFAYMPQIVKEFMLPQEYIESCDLNDDKVRDKLISTYWLPFIIRPSLIKQLYYSDNLICPLCPEVSKFPVEGVVTFSGNECDFYGFRRLDFNKTCTFNVLLNNLGLRAVDNDLLII